MKYILDFDGTIFNTRAFVERLNEEGLGDVPRGRELISQIENKNIDLTEFIYPDVMNVLTDGEHQSIILSSYVSSTRNESIGEDELVFFQEAKIRLSGITKTAQEVVFVGKDKREKLQEIYDLYKEEGVAFVDDRSEHVSSAQEIGYITAQIYRESRGLRSPEMVTSSSELQQVGSLSEFVRYVERTEKVK